MTKLPPPTSGLEALIADALAMLRDYEAPIYPRLPAEPLPSLLEECEALCAASPGGDPIRLIHHFACTGGTLISKCVAALPNTVLLSEIDPLSTLYWVKQHGESFTIREDRVSFRPTDLVMALRTSLRTTPEQVLVDTFVAGVVTAHRALSSRGQFLVIRDHPHSQFCTAVDPDARPTVREMLGDSQPRLSVVTVRHPLDSFLAMHAHNWRHFDPFTLDAYAHRYAAFLKRHDALPIVRYEDFVADPETALAAIAGHLALPFSSLALDLFSVALLSGDSGRKGNVIGARSRRTVPEAILAESGSSQAYADLCARLGYKPDPHG